MAGRRHLVTLPPPPLLMLAAAAFLAAGAAGGKPSAKFELIHRDRASWEEVARMDQERAAFICSHARRRRATEEAAAVRASHKHKAKATAAAPAADEAFAMPLSSGAYTGTGQYFVRFRVGTPARPFLLVADTGSDLTWVKCRRRHDAPTPAPAPAPAPGYGYAAPPASNVSSSLSAAAAAAASSSSHARVFRPDRSRTWAPIPCSSDTCTASLPFSLAACPTPGSPCAYDYRYKDGSAARGTVGTDSATIALSSGRAGAASSKKRQRQAKLRGVVLGCTTSYNGESFLASDGVLSLGYSNISFASRAAARFGGRFSYCLVDHLAPRNATSYLTFGPNPAVSSASASETSTACVGSPPPAAPVPGAARQTPLLLDHRMRPFYAVTVNGISVDGELLKIPRLVWDVEKGGGAILDSGTSLTVLVSPAYRAVVAALSGKLAGLPRVSMDPFDYCYNWTSPSTGEDLAVAVPELAVHFAGSARLQPPAKSYVIDAAPGVKCIGLQEGDWPGVSVIGNILQQEHLWEFDLKNRRLRFKRSRCLQ